ncbi:VOC family protein [Polyangium mundeleinium]|uniref:VOC family protein n=1 Tax=Polyangium mundeleinium TaxID=2995306 RepID=A0ABT5EVG9_9BACT|nr:VOC family protein [Polyangium mundeleinium]MDC0745364.1 VOC family protein [Polyangium mundeleinium]
MSMNPSSPPPAEPSGLPVIRLRVDDIEAALSFYRRVFEADADDADPHALYPEGNRALVFRILGPDEGPQPTAGDVEDEDAATPRCELVVDDVEAWLERAGDAGGTVKARVVDDRGRVTYGQWRDPFGHLWALSAADR